MLLYFFYALILPIIIGGISHLILEKFNVREDGWNLYLIVGLQCVVVFYIWFKALMHYNIF